MTSPGHGFDSRIVTALFGSRGEPRLRGRRVRCPATVWVLILTMAHAFLMWGPVFGNCLILWDFIFLIFFLENPLDFVDFYY